MNLTPLENNGPISAEQFNELFKSQLGENFDRAFDVFTNFGDFNSFSVSNVLHLSLQKGNLDEVLDALEKWWEVVSIIWSTQHIRAQADTREFFDIVYSQFFMSRGDTIDGIQIPPIYLKRKSGLWLPN